MSKPVEYGHFMSKSLAQSAADGIEARSNCTATVRKKRGYRSHPWVVEIPRTCSIAKKLRYK